MTNLDKLKKEWLELEVGDAKDKAKDFFTIGEVEFINNLLTKSYKLGKGERLQEIAGETWIKEQVGKSMETNKDTLQKLSWYDKQTPKKGKGDAVKALTKLSKLMREDKE